MAVKSSWISDCFDKSSSNEKERKKSNTYRVVPCRKEMSKVNYNSMKREKMVNDWLKEYSPETPTDLVIQKPKLEQLNLWLKKASNTVGEVPILMITGPPGVGKSTALKVLAAAQKIQVIEWTSPMDIDTTELEGSRYLTQSQASKFESFLMNTGRYMSILETGKSMKKLILLKELPNTFALQPNALHQILRSYHTLGRVPLVFSLLEQVEKNGVLLPKQIQEEMNIQQISFNKVPDKSVMKVLKKICSLNEEYTVPSSVVLDKIVENARGDIRNAILQFCYEFTQSGCTTSEQNFDCPQEVSRGKKRKKTESSGKGKQQHSGKISKNPMDVTETSESLKAGGKDRQLPIFRRVGRLLYPKKSNEDVGALTHDPEEIVEQTLSHPRRLLQMVHENYLKIFRDMNDTCHAIYYASDADAMMTEFRERDLTLPMALSTAVRGFMTCNPAAVRKYTPLTNQEYNTVRRRIQAMRETIIHSDPKYILVPRDAAMDILPIIHAGFSTRLGPAHYVDVVQYSTSDEDDEVSSLSCHPESTERIGENRTEINSTSEVKDNARKRLAGGRPLEVNIKNEEVILEDLAYEIQESDSDDDQNDRKDYTDVWVEEDARFLENLPCF